MKPPAPVFVLSDKEEERIKRDNTLRMYKEIVQMLEIYYPGFWDGVDDEKIKLAWVEKADEIVGHYYKKNRGRLEIMASVCAIIGLDFETNPKLEFIVKRLKSTEYDTPLRHLRDYLRFEVLKKDFDEQGYYYNSWSLRGTQEGMPRYTRHVPDFYTENKPGDPNEDVWNKYVETVRYGGKL